MGLFYIVVGSMVSPIMLMSAFYQFTIPVFTVSGLLLYISVRKQKLWWLSIIGFLFIGAYWLSLAVLLALMPLD